MRFLIFISVGISILGTCSSANAGILLSPTSAGSLAGTGVTDVGGIVLDLVGTNGTRVVSQLAASSLHVGFSGSNNPLEIGTQTGFTPAIVASLGGGISEAAVRITLFDGDTAPGDFDDGENDLLLNGTNFGDFSDVNTSETDSTGTAVISTGTGFGDGILSTGFFFSNNAAALTALFNSIQAAGEVLFELDDVDLDDNFFDFTLGVDGGIIDAGQGPSTGGGVVPEPSSLIVWSLVGLGCIVRRRLKPVA